MGERRKSIPCSEEHWAATNGTLEKASSFTHNTSFSNACNHIKGTTTTFGIVPEVKYDSSLFISFDIFFEQTFLLNTKTDHKDHLPKQTQRCIATTRER